MTLAQVILDFLREKGPQSVPEIQEHAMDAGYELTGVKVELHRMKEKGMVDHLSKYKGHSLYGAPELDSDDDPTAGW